MSSPSQSDKAIAKAVATAFGGRPRVTRFYDEAREQHVDVLDAVDRPQAGVQSCGTVGLSNHAMSLDGEKYPVRVELVGACAGVFTEFRNVVASCAFNIINSRMFCAPGIIFDGVFAAYRPQSAMRHVLFLPPFLWDGLDSREFDGRSVAWLMLVPVSDRERAYAVANGPSALEEVFEREQIDIFDPDRLSVV